MKNFLVALGLLGIAIGTGMKDAPYVGDEFIRSLVYSQDANYYLGTGGAAIIGHGAYDVFGIIAARAEVAE